VSHDGKWKNWNNVWHPAVAAAADGRFSVVGDEDSPGDYDVWVMTYTGNNAVPGQVACSSRFEARPSVAYDAQGRLWIAYEEGPEKWGKDYGAQAAGKGNPLYNERSVRVVCLQNGKLMRPAAELPTSKYEPPV